MRSRLVDRILLLGALLVEAPVEAQPTPQGSAATPFVRPKRAFIKGKVARAESFELEGASAYGRTDAPQRFSIVVLEGVEPAEAFPLPEKRSEIVPFSAAAARCTKYFAMFTGPTRDEVTALAGKTVTGVVSMDPTARDADKESKVECLLVDSLERVLPAAKPVSFNLWTLTDTPATLARLEQARSLFEPETKEIRFFDQTPIDGAIEYALRNMKSREALELAMRMRMYFAIRSNSAWVNDPASYAVFERAILEPGDHPHPYLSELFWHASSSKALAKIDELVTTRPLLAADILRENAGWVSGSALFEEMVDAKKIALGSPRALLELGTEDAFLERHREDTPSFTAAIDKALAASKERSEKGITDGWSLVRWVAKNKKADRFAQGMRITLTGTKASCCDLRAEISSDVDLEVRADCDAEQHRAYCDAKDAPSTRTITGVVKAVQLSRHRLAAGEPDRPIVRVELQSATVVDGGEIPAPSSLDDVPSAHPPTVPSADSQPSSGCGCAASSDPVGGLAGALAIVAALAASRFGRTGARARANPARGRAG